MEVKIYGKTITIRGLRSASEMEPYWPGFESMWRDIREICGTRCRAPKSVSMSEEPQMLHANDYEVARRVVVDIATGRIMGERHVSTGECAINAGRAMMPVSNVPAKVAMLDCVWSDYYRHFAIRAQFPVGTLTTKFLPTAEV